MHRWICCFRGAAAPGHSRLADPPTVREAALQEFIQKLIHAAGAAAPEASTMTELREISRTLESEDREVQRLLKVLMDSLPVSPASALAPTHISLEVFLAALPSSSAISVFDLQGQALYQNPASEDHMGHVVGLPVPGLDESFSVLGEGSGVPGFSSLPEDHPLRRLFSKEPEPVLRRIMEDLQHGKVFRQRMSVPASMKLHVPAESASAAAKRAVVSNPGQASGFMGSHFSSSRDTRERQTMPATTTMTSVRMNSDICSSIPTPQAGVVQPLNDFPGANRSALDPALKSAQHNAAPLLGQQQSVDNQGSQSSTSRITDGDHVPELYIQSPYNAGQELVDAANPPGPNSRIAGVAMALRSCIPSKQPQSILQHPRDLETPMRSLSVINWDRRAAVAMPTVRFQTEDAVSRQMVLLRSAFDSGATSTAAATSEYNASRASQLMWQRQSTGMPSSSWSRRSASNSLHARDSTPSEIGTEDVHPPCVPGMGSASNVPLYMLEMPAGAGTIMEEGSEIDMPHECFIRELSGHIAIQSGGQSSGRLMAPEVPGDISSTPVNTSDYGRRLQQLPPPLQYSAPIASQFRVTPAEAFSTSALPAVTASLGSNRTAHFADGQHLPSAAHTTSLSVDASSGRSPSPLPRAATSLRLPEDSNTVDVQLHPRSSLPTAPGDRTLPRSRSDKDPLQIPTKRPKKRGTLERLSHLVSGIQGLSTSNPRRSPGPPPGCETQDRTTPDSPPGRPERRSQDLPPKAQTLRRSAPGAARANSQLRNQLLHESSKPRSPGSVHHEVCLLLVQGGGQASSLGVLPAKPLLVMAQHQVEDSTSRALMEVLREEHKMLEAIFPRHVVQSFVKKVTSGLQKERLGPAAAPVAPATDGSLPLDLPFSLTASYHSCVTILFCDIVGFTNMCKQVEPIIVMDFLNSLYLKFDELSDIYGVYKVETIGDCYMVVSGLTHSSKNSRGLEERYRMSAIKAIAFAKALLLEATTVMMPVSATPVQLRIGIHSGPVMSGIIGNKMPRFCLFGDSVNTASRMESTCPVETIQVSSDTWNMVKQSEMKNWKATQGVEVKGKGMMSTYTWSWHQDNISRCSL